MSEKRTLVSRVTESLYRGLYAVLGKIPWPSAEAAMTLNEGQDAPDFSAVTDNGHAIKLSDFRGKEVVLYFYPKDDTPGCTVEACSFRDNLRAFADKNAVILGVSVDSVNSHRAFKQKYHLPFTLLSDSDGAIAKAYDVYNDSWNMAKRWTFVIDARGKIKKIFSDVKVDGHSQEILSTLR